MTFQCRCSKARKKITDAKVRITKIDDEITGMEVGEMRLVSSQIYAIYARAVQLELESRKQKRGGRPR